METSTSGAQSQKLSQWHRPAWLPIPLLLAAIIAARVAGLNDIYESQTLLLLLSCTFYTLVSLGTLYLIGRSFLASGSPGLLLLECGVVFWSLSGTVGDFVYHGDTNINVTIFNIGILLAGLCHLAGAILTRGPQRALRAKVMWLAAGCALALAALWLIAQAALAGWLPIFFIPGHGGTLVRYCVLISAISLFVLSAGMLKVGQRTMRLPFTSWYIHALLLLAVGLFGIMIQLSMGSVVNWLSRTAQWLGGLYLLLAALASLRGSRLPLLPPENKSQPAYYQYAIAVAVVITATAIRLTFLSALGTKAPFVIFYPAVMFAALYGGLRGGLLATALSAILADYFLMEPIHQPTIVQPSDWLALVIFLLSGAMISWITESLHRATARASAAETQALLAAEHEKAEEAIKQNHKTFTELIERSPFGTYVVDSQFRIAMMNASSQTGAFRNVRPVVGRPFEEAMRTLWPENVAVEIIGHFRHTLDTGEPYYSRDFVRPRSDVAMVEAYEWELHRMSLPDGQHGVICFYYDSTKLREAEAAVYESEEQLRSLAENIPCVLMRFDRQLRILYMNPQSEKYNAIPVERLIGRTNREVGMPLELCDLWDAAIERVFSTGTQEEMVFGLAGPSGMRTFALAFAPEFGPDHEVRYVLGFSSDITERKQAEESLRESEERLALAASSTQIGMFDWNLARGTILWTQTHEAIFGYAAATTTTTTTKHHYSRWADRVHPEDLPNVDAESRRCMQERVPFEVQYRIIWPDGSRHWVETRGVFQYDSYGKASRMLGVVMDITERKRAEETLHASEERLHIALRASQAGSWDWDIETGELNWSPELFQLFGLDPTTTEATFDSWRSVIHPEDLQIAEYNVEQAIRNHTQLASEYRVIAQAGQMRWIHALGNTTYDSDGRAVWMTGICIDTTTRKLAELALHESEQLFRVLIKNLQSAVALVNESGAFMIVNQAFLRMFDLADDSNIKNVNDRDWSQWQVFDEQGALLSVDEHPVRKTVLTGKPVRDQLVAVKAPTNPELKWMLVSAEPVLDAQGHIHRLVCTYYDITARKQDEEALRRQSEAALNLSEQEFRSLAEAMPQIVWATRPDGWNIYFNQQWMDYTGMTRAESYGHGWNKPFHPDDKQRAWDAWQLAIQQNERYSMECRLRRADGVYRWWLVRGEPMRGANGEILKWFGTCTDIEEIKRSKIFLREANALLEQRVAERTAALRESEALYRGIGESIDYGVWVCAADGRNTYASKSFLNMVGITQEQCSNFGWGDLLHPDDAERTIAAWQECVRTGGNWDIEHRFRGVDGQWHHVLARGVPVRNEQGEIISWAGINLDISRLKQAEEALRESEDRFRLALHNAPVSVAAQDLDLRYIWAYNHRTAGPDEIIGHFDSEIFMPDEAELITARKRRVIEEDIELREQMWLNRPEGRIFLDIYWEPIHNAAGQVIGVGSATVDLTPIMLVEEALRLSEEKFAAAFANNPAAIALTRLEDGLFFEVNDTWLMLHGFTREETIGNFSRKMNIWPNTEDTARFLNELRAKGVLRAWEQVFRKKSGAMFTAEISAQLLTVNGEQAILSTLVDITARKQAEEALRLTQESIDGAAEMVAWFVPDGRVHYVNDATCRILGYSRDELLQMTAMDFSPGFTWEQYREHWREVRERKSFTLETLHRRKDGSVYPAEVLVNYVLYGGQEYIFAYGKDITERKQAEEALKSSLNEKEVLLKEIHHRVKNNLQVISSLVNLQVDAAKDEAVREALKDVTFRVRSMALIHEKLYQTNDLAQLNFADYATSLLRSLWRSNGRLAEKARLHLELAPVTLSIEAAVPCGLILNELAGNALKHAFPHAGGGEVTVGIRHDLSNNSVCLVHDNGVGLPADLDWQKSSSLGLRLVKILAGQLGGTVETGTGPGTEFRIIFPLKECKS